MVRVALVVREGLQGGTRISLLSVFVHKKYIHSWSFYLSGSVNKFLNFCVGYFPCCFLKMAIKICKQLTSHNTRILKLTQWSISGWAFSPPWCFSPPYRPLWFFRPLAHQNRPQGGDSTHFEKHCSRRFSMGFRGISRLGSAFIFLRWFKLAHISIQVTSLHRFEYRYQCCAIFACFSSCVLGVFNSPVTTLAHGLLELNPSLRLRSVSDNASLLALYICANTTVQFH